MTTEERLTEATKLLNEAVEHMADVGTVPPDEWLKRFFLFDGTHMILTEEGWECGECKAMIVKEAHELGVPLSDFIKDEVNASA